jgi:hypothetical protein
MALGLTDRAERRAAEVHAAIRGALSEAASKQAFSTAISALQSECKKVRERRPAAGALIDAEVAGTIAALAASIHARRPRKPEGCPRVPGPEHLLAVFDSAYSPDMNAIAAHISALIGVDHASVAAVLTAYQEI